MSSDFNVEPEFEVAASGIISHIKTKLISKGIQYIPSKIDYQIVNYVIKLFHKNKKGGYSIIKFVDECLDKVIEAQGLGFLSSLARKKFNVERTTQKRHKTVISPEALTISDTMNKNLKHLKKKYGL